MSQTPILLNGKFLSAAPTGVHRVANELIVNMDRLLADAPDRAGQPWALLCPKDSYQPLPLSRIERKQVGFTTWQSWEQLELPRIAKDGVLVSLCNLAPLAHRRNVILIHDAQVFLSPDSYSTPFRAWYRFALPRIGASAARIVTVSSYSRDRLVEFGVAPADKISVVHNGIDHFGQVASDDSIIARLGLRPGSFVVAPSSARKHKNVAVLFDAFRSATLNHIALVLIGDDDAKVYTAAEIQPSPGAIFTGRVTDAELRALYENAACLAFPSTTEGFGLPPLEAMSLGCPAIVAPCGALPEVCGEAALYVQPHDPAGWVQAILGLSDDVEARTRLRIAGHLQAAQFRWETSARKLLDIIDAVAADLPDGRSGRSAPDGHGGDAKHRGATDRQPADHAHVDHTA